MEAGALASLIVCMAVLVFLGALFEQRFVRCVGTGRVVAGNNSSKLVNECLCWTIGHHITIVGNELNGDGFLESEQNFFGGVASFAQGPVHQE